MITSSYIFDFGNVLVHFRPLEMTKAYVLDDKDAALIAEVLFSREIWDRLDDGSISDEEVKETSCRLLPKRLWDKTCFVYDHWMEQLPEIDGMRENLLYLKERGSRLYLLSNISRSFAAHYVDVPSVKSLLDLFDGCVFSGPLGIVKPSDKIFGYLLEKYHVDPADCTFVDDSEKNIIGAKAVGLKAYLFDGDAERFRTFLNR